MVLTRSQVKQQTSHKYETRLQSSRETMRQQYQLMMDQNEEKITKNICKTPISPVTKALRRSQRIRIMM
tara:strand:- start:6244 stop:6450 length:207 start_codon:yes stop_codon:yes gene_type:complete